MAFDTRLGTRGKPSRRAPSRIAPSSRHGGETPAARGMQARARTSTLSSLASGGSTHAAAALSRRTTKIERAQNVLRKAQLASAAPGLSPEQNHVLSQVLHSGQHSHASKQALLSAVETGLVESDLKNLPGGDADSAGWRQERASIYPNPTNVKASAGRYFSEAKAAGPHPSAGQLAADVQRPAEQYRGRYDEVQGRAESILKSARAKKVPPPKLAKAKLALTKLGASARPTKGQGSPTKRKASIAELFYDPGVSIKEGSQVGAIGGHTDHVHIAADDPRSEKRFIRIAQKQGLHVGENVFVGDTPEPGVHVSDSYHYRTYTLPSGKKISGAADVTGTAQQMMAFDQFIAKKFGGNPGAKGVSFTSSGGGGVTLSGSAGVASFAKAAGVSKAQAKAMTPKQRFNKLYAALRSSRNALGAGGTTGVGGSARSTTPTPTRRYNAPARSARLGLS